MFAVRPQVSLPAVRAHWAKFTVATAKSAPPELRDAALSMIDKNLRAEIRSASMLEWQPAETFMRLCDALTCRGDDFARAFWRHSLHASISQPLISVLVSGGTTLFGRSPAALYKRTPRAWDLVTRACGELRVEGETDDGLALVAEDLPSVCRSSLGLVRMWEGGFAAQADFVGFRVSVESDVSELAAVGRVRFALKWWPK